MPWLGVRNHPLVNVYICIRRHDSAIFIFTNTYKIAMCAEKPKENNEMVNIESETHLNSQISRQMAENTCS